MSEKLKRSTDVIDAFAAAYPGAGALRCLDWVGAWRACYPQFEDAIFAKATTLFLKDGEAHKAANAAAQGAPAVPAPMDPEDMETVRLQFVGLDDPTPEDLTRWMNAYPIMADELTELATTMSVMAYLRLPPRPPTRAERAGEERQIATLVAQIVSGTLPKPRAEAPARKRVALPTGAALRAKRMAAVESYRSEMEARRKAGGTAR